MEKWFCIWDLLLRLFAIARVANPKIGLNLISNPLQYQNVGRNYLKKHEKETKT
jgi:membrane-associated PAP2 superfamily phosphatase